MSIVRAAAPPWRTYWCESRMPRLPLVAKSPQARLRFTLSPGVGYSILTLDQLHSSSSAASCARPVIVPCPISERTTRMLTVSSGAIATQTPISGEPSCARATAGPPKGMRRPRARPPPTAAEETMKERRVILMACPLCRLRGGVDRFAHLLEGAAATDVGDRGVDVRVGRLRLLLQERRDGHDHARLAVAASRHVVLDPGLLHLVRGLAPGKTPHKVQKAWLDHDVPQCGYCQSGMIMAVAALLKQKPKPTDADIDAAITNICRCGTFQQVREAIHMAAKTA